MKDPDNENQPQFRYTLRLWIFAILLLWGLVACGSSPVAQAPSIGEPRLNPPTAVKPGDEVSINIDVSNTSDTDFTYSWTADGGNIIRGGNSPAATYKAPNEPGVYNVTVEIKWGDQKTSKSASIKVESEPTSASQPTASLQPTTPSQVITPTTQPSTTASPPPPPATPTSEAVTITSPKDGDQVNCETVVQGTYASDINGTIWPVVLTASRFHPQDVGGHAPPVNNGKFIVTVHFGNCSQPAQDAGKPFQLFIAIADESANKAFEDHLRDAAAQGYPGMENLPDGVTVIGPISVTRR